MQFTNMNADLLSDCSVKYMLWKVRHNLLSSTSVSLFYTYASDTGKFQQGSRKLKLEVTYGIWGVICLGPGSRNTLESCVFLSVLHSLSLKLFQTKVKQNPQNSHV